MPESYIPGNVEFYVSAAAEYNSTYQTTLTILTGYPFLPYTEYAGFGLCIR